VNREAKGVPSVVGMFKAIMESFPDCNWKIENARINVHEVNGLSMRAVTGYYKFSGRRAVLRVTCALNICGAVVVGTLVKVVFEEIFEQFDTCDTARAHALRDQRPQMQLVTSIGMYILLLNELNEICGLFLLYNSQAREVPASKFND
jgi:hypothetical protein